MATPADPMLDRVKALLGTLPREQQEMLRDYLVDILPTEREIERALAPAPHGGAPRRGKVTRRQERVRCGRAGCKCEKPEGAHGPYWYEYWRDDRGRLRKRYAGAVRPRARRAGAAGASASG